MSEAYSKPKQEQALVLYMNRDGTLAEIAKQVGVPVKTVHTWHYRNQWSRIRREIEASRTTDFLENLRKAGMLRGISLMLRHLDLSDHISSAIGHRLEEGNPDEQDLAHLARALKTSFSIVAQYFPINDGSKPTIQDSLGRALIVPGMLPRVPA